MPQRNGKNSLQIKVKRFDTALPLPSYKTPGAVAMDLVARVTTTIEAGTVGYVPLNVAFQLPPGTWALLAARSSLHKRGVQLINGIGIGDEDFCGDNDEYQAALYNFGSEAVTLERGERLVQLMVHQYQRVEWAEVPVLGTPSRGGFGSTGRK